MKELALEYKKLSDQILNRQKQAQKNQSEIMTLETFSESLFMIHLFSYNKIHIVPTVNFMKNNEVNFNWDQTILVEDGDVLDHKHVGLYIDLDVCGDGNYSYFIYDIDGQQYFNDVIPVIHGLDDNLKMVLLNKKRHRIMRFIKSFFKKKFLTNPKNDVYY